MFRVRVARTAERDLDDMIDWLAMRNPVVAARVSSEIQTVLRRDLRETPKRYRYFWITGEPFRGRLFSVSRNMKYWIVYSVDDPARSVRVVRIWNASRNPAAFEL
jgi:plasmid stabilization system protein ParE